jgi:hypothetical protein
MGARPRPVTDRMRETFLAALEAGESVSAACLTAGIPRRSAYKLRQRDEAFALAWHDALEAGTDLYEDEARRRAIEGVEKPIMYQGKQVGSVREYSDRMLELILKARRPEKYRERHDVQHSVAPMSPEEMKAAREAGMDPAVEEAARVIAALPVLPKPDGAVAADVDG